MTDEEKKLLEKRFEALERLHTAEEHGQAMLMLLDDLRDHEVDATTLATIAFAFTHAQETWNDDDAGRAAVLFGEAAVLHGHPGALMYPTMALAKAAVRQPGQLSPWVYNVVVAQGLLRTPQSSKTFGGIRARELINHDGLDARGLIHLAENQLNRTPTGSPHRPQLWLDLAQGFGQLARRDGGDPRAWVAARYALGRARTEQDSLPVGIGDPEVWLESAYLWSTFPADDPEKARREEAKLLTRALRAVAERGDARVTTIAIERGLAFLRAAHSVTGARSESSTLFRALIGFPLNETQQALVLFVLANDITLDVVQQHTPPHRLGEAESAARRALALQPDNEEFRRVIAWVLGAQGKFATDADTALAKAAELRSWIGSRVPEWSQLAAIGIALLRAIDLGADRRIALEAVAIAESFPHSGPAERGIEGYRKQLRVDAYFHLFPVDPERAMVGLRQELAARERLGSWTGLAIALAADLALTATVNSADEAASELQKEASLWPGDSELNLFEAVQALQEQPGVAALGHIMPSGLAASEIALAAAERIATLPVRHLALRLVRSDDELLPEVVEMLDYPGLDDAAVRSFRNIAGRTYFNRFVEMNDPAALSRAEELVVPADSKADLGVADLMLLLVVLDAAARRDRRPLTIGDRRIVVLQELRDRKDVSLEVRLRIAARLQVSLGGLWGLVWTQFTAVADDLIDRVRSGGAAEVLSYAQGIASRASYAAALGGDAIKAIEIAERGQGILAAAAMQQYGVSTELLHVAQPRLYAAWSVAARRLQSAIQGSVPQLDSWNSHVPTDPPTRRVTPTELLAELSTGSPQVAGLVAAERAARSDLEAAVGAILPDPTVATMVSHLQVTGGRLVYLIASGWGGMGVVLHADGRIRSVVLPALGSDAVQRWMTALNDAEPESVTRAPVRGVASEPPRESSLAVLSELATALAPLEQSLGETEGPIQLVPMGELALLPVVAGLQWLRPDDNWLELSVAASGRLHIAAATRLKRTAGNTAVVAVTNPSPATRSDGTTFRDLPAATREGDEVAGVDGGVHHTQGTATLAASVDALRGANLVLHFAVHGEADPDAPERSRMYLADGPGGVASALSAAEVASSPINTRLVYLGSCWTGRPGERLPDEAVGFPTLLLQAGAAAVVAPLWPIDDAAAYTFATAFYRSWRSGTTPAQALADAMRHTRSWHPRSMTWAAFSLHGV
ncbi:hypothetical protein C3B59_17385 [Cryobacterium zongtaii]|uniref:CHAT domain-containing protein n=1 Tax=Cryobacterium zongtaii TaxID=1259217 RepID=A0A2S3Z626_9MICO|nr:CHAT domain-containing protein [Cryobacterium zongtaii]POH59665.1 hypothetical protein C3B59_17385 [Cryobacterium zongtaii]